MMLSDCCYLTQAIITRVLATCSAWILLRVLNLLTFLSIVIPVLYEASEGSESSARANHYHRCSRPER